ncbi:hypothetical protein N7E81_19225 [Reichenbachiella carrageenanivorans]|uniref:Uncharacterized protein n=1 Tax=Reichenbachiella carrageenanivorans TaxID=2979869 RepID=A0ABY6CZY6_9BACT|nr:hypothetical protein [Reichenbachiella carrageenanivorans]UXX78499.1 hypothetical protein N7E81_14145 [Reichenbachiella carrageenanivorans]UXX79480.1 hypothetical protein N7E81_19215 [Reichenbachiella carrageenanivorans]UXX79482.1 hypothetical protein N7E81_19225 [Reichenbachiella carrageenanivorans]
MQFKLTEEILKLSESKIWNQAKNEWTFEYAYSSEELQSCLCGHYPIKNICVLNNSENNNTTEVGNCCVNKFLGIEDGNKIFTSIKRLKEDLTKSMSSEVLEFLFSKKVVSEFEYKFYSDTIRKRKLSTKQETIRERINQKLLDFTSGEANTQFSRINLVLKWADQNTWFDTTFVKSLNESCKRKGKLTDAQKGSLEKIIFKCKIE